MHIPDGFLDARTAAATGGIAALGLGIALRRVRRVLPACRIPLIGLAAAFVFAAQMLNFPVAGGTSGHLIGAVLVAVLLGPSAAVVVMSAVLILQCMMFADGGLTALGANILNMAIIAPCVGYGVFRVVRRIAGEGLRGLLLATAFASWCSTVVAAIACAGQLARSGTVKWGLAFPAMAWVHMLIGIGEALITTLVVAAVARARPELVLERPQRAFQRGLRALTVRGALTSLGLVAVAALLACGWPDGLQKVAALLGFERLAERVPMLPSLFPHYAVPGMRSTILSTLVAGCLGTLAAFLFAYVVARAQTPPGSPGEDRDPEHGPSHAHRSS